LADTNGKRTSIITGVVVSNYFLVSPVAQQNNSQQQKIQGTILSE
jgi:hypothetical protein